MEGAEEVEMALKGKWKKNGKPDPQGSHCKPGDKEGRGREQGGA